MPIRDKILGYEHPDTATSLNNLAVLLVNQGKYDEAELMFRRSLAIRETVLDTEHADTIDSLANLANLLKIRSNYIEAIQYYYSLLIHYEKHKGLITLEVSITCWNIAICSWEIDELDDAEYYFRRELEILKEVNGDNHHTTLDSMQQLGVFLHDFGNYLEDELLLRKVIDQW